MANSALKSDPRYGFSTTQRHVATLLMGIAMGALSACGGSSVPPEPASVLIDTKPPSATLTTTQATALSAANASLASGAPTKAISEASAVLASAGYNEAAMQTLGQAYAAQALMDSKSLGLVAGTSTDATAKLSGLTNLLSYETTDSGSMSPNYTTLVKNGDAALNMMVPPGTAVSSLSPALQKEVAVASTVQALRVLNSVVQAPDPSALTTAQANAAVDTNYTATQQTQLENAAKLLVQAPAAAAEAFSNSSAVTSAFVGTLSKSLTTMTADGVLDKADVKQLAVVFKANVPK
jgi:hypothetical protein